MKLAEFCIITGTPPKHDRKLTEEELAYIKFVSNEVTRLLYGDVEFGNKFTYEDPTSEVTHGVVTKVDLEKKEITISTEEKVKNPKE